MALDKYSSSASKLAATVATGLVSVFAALPANAHGGPGGAQGGYAHGGGRVVVGGPRFAGGGYYGYRGPRFIVGYGLPYYGPAYVVARVVIAPPVYIVRATPHRQAQPQPSARTFCYDGKDETVCDGPNGITHIPRLHLATAATPPPAPVTNTVAPPAAKPPVAETCTKAVVQVHAFNSTSALDRQFTQQDAGDNCLPKITRINAYNDLAATGIGVTDDKANGSKTVSISYNGIATETSSNFSTETSFLKGHAGEVFNIAATTPSSTGVDFPVISHKSTTNVRTTLSSADAPADSIVVTLKTRNNTVNVNHDPQSAAADAIASTNSSAANANSPQKFASASATTKDSSHNGLWWTLGSLGLLAAGALGYALHQGRRANQSVKPPVPPTGPGDGQNTHGPSSEVSHMPQSNEPRGTATPEALATGATATASLRTFTDADKRGVMSAFHDNSAGTSSQLAFDFNKGRVTTADANIDIRQNSMKATTKAGVAEFSDATIKGMLESHYNLNGGANHAGKHYIEVKCDDATYDRVVKLANETTGQPFKIVRKRPEMEIEIEPVRTSRAANEPRYPIPQHAA